MQPAEKDEDSATQSGRRGDNDDEVISTTSSVSAEHPVDGQEAVSTNNKIEKMVEVLYCKVGDARHRHGRVEVPDKLARQAGEGNDTRSGGEFQQDDAVRERRNREGTAEPRRENSGHVSRCRNAEVAMRGIECVPPRSRSSTSK